MKLITTCKSCNANIQIKESVIDRVDLVKEMGEQFNLVCVECFSENKYYPMEVVAKEKKITAVIGFIILFFGTGTAVYFLKDFLLTPGSPVNFISFGLVLILPSAFYRKLIGTEIDNVRRFNAYRV